MKDKGKVIALVTVIAMTFLFLIGIGILFMKLNVIPMLEQMKSPAAQELLDGIEAIDQEKYNDMEMTMDMHVEADGQTVNLSMVAGIEMLRDVVHMYDTTMDVSTSGLSFSVGMEGWIDYAEKTSYMNMSAMGQETGWTKSSVEENSGAAADITRMASMFSNGSASNTEIVLAEHEKGQDYVVEWFMGADDIADIISGMVEDYNTNGDAVSFDSLKVTARFDEETKIVKSISMVATGEKNNSNADLEVTITFKTINGESSLSVPADVISSAATDGLIIEDAGDGTGFDDTYDEGFNVDAGDSGYTGETFVNDEAGYDDVIDPIAEYLAANDDGTGVVYLNHYEGMASLEYYFSKDDWSATLEVERVSPDCDWTSLDEEFDTNYTWLAESWYEPENLVEGSREEKRAIFMKDSMDRDVDMDFISCQDGLLVQLSVYVYEGDRDTAMACMTEMLEKLP